MSKIYSPNKHVIKQRGNECGKVVDYVSKGGYGVGN